MNSRRTAVAALALCVALVSACKKEEPKATGTDAAPPTTSTSTPTTPTPPTPPTTPTATVALPIAPPPAGPIPAGAFNKSFPKDGEGGFTRVFAPDKEGYAEAKLLKGGKEVAVVSITDADRLAYAKAKYGSSTDKVDGFPIVQSGTNQTSALVKERFQVKVTSATLDHEARKAILATFDLKGL